MDGTTGPVAVDGHGPPPVEITAYRNAEELLVDFGMTCARTRGMQVLCADEDIEERMPGRMRDRFLHLDLDGVCLFGYPHILGLGVTFIRHIALSC